MRILVLLAIGLLLILIFRNLWRKTKSTPPMPQASENMVRCEHCGLHLIPKEAIRKDKLYFCSHEHVEAYLNK